MNRHLTYFATICGFLIILYAGGAWGDTYYVDCNAAAGGDGSLSTPWDAIADVNAASFSGDDNILFAKGCTWREQLTVPSSGTSGHPITFGAYGSGADPIFNGADLVTTWTQYSTPATTNETVDGFEDSTTNAWNANANGVVDAESKQTGSYGYHCDLVASCTLDEQFVAGHDEVGLSGSFYLNAESLADGNKTRLVQLATNAYGVIATLWLSQSSGNLYVDAVNSATPAATFQITTGVWYDFDVRAKIGNGTGTVQLWIDGDKKVDDSGLNTGTTQLQRIRIGAEGWNDESVDVYYDDLTSYSVGTATPTDAYSASVAWTAHSVFENNTKLTEIAWDTDIATTYPSMTAGSWTLDDANNLIYMIATDNSDPDTKIIEVSGNREYAFYGWHKNYISVSDLSGKYAYKSGFYNLGGTNWIIDSVTSTYNHEHGIRIEGQDGFPTDNTTVSNSSISYNDYAGIDVYNYGAAITVSSNTVHHNVLRVGSTSGGIKINDPTLGTVTIERNTVYNNGPATPAEGEGSGIWVDSTDGGNIVRYNLIYANGDYGIYLENEPNGNEVYYNIVHSHTSTATAYTGSGIYLQRQAKGNKVYNNISYGNRIGIGVIGDVPAAAGSCVNNLVKNNISTGNTVRQLSAWFGGENDGTNGSGNVYTYNSFGPEAANFIEWAAGTYKSTYDLWETAYGGTTNSVEADPLFISTVTPDFHLQSTSPARDAGVGVGLTTDYEGETIEGLPNIGAYETPNYHPDLATIESAAVTNNSTQGE